jgi:hypothetical protein
MRGLPTVFGFLSFFPHATPFSPPPQPPHPTRAIKSTKTPSISLESVLRACGLYELSFTCLGALFLAGLSCFSPDFVFLRPQPQRDRHPTFSRPSGTPPFAEDTGPPPHLFGCGDIFGGNLGATSLRDMVFFGTLHVGYTTFRPSGTIGLWARPIPPHQQPRKQYRISFPNPPLWETPQSPQPLPPASSGPYTTFWPPATAFGHPWALGSTHPNPQPRKQYRPSFPKPPLWETPQSPQPPLLAPGPTTTTSDGAACLAVTPPPPTAPAVSPPPSVDVNHG